MSLQLHLQRPDPLYYCWKNARNFFVSIDELEHKWGCKTIHINRNSGYLVSVEVLFLSETHKSWFLLGWS